MGNASEEEYFHRQNQDLLNSLREKNRKEDAAKSKAELKSLHWMHCPKCGETMKESIVEGVTIDRCQGCEGIYLDKGELEQIINASKPKNILRLIHTQEEPSETEPAQIAKTGSEG